MNHKELANSLGVSVRSLLDHRKKLEEKYNIQLVNISGNTAQYKDEFIWLIKKSINHELLPESLVAPVQTVQTVETVDSELIEESEQLGIVQFQNGFHASSALSFRTQNNQELSQHLVDESTKSGMSTAQTISNLVAGLLDSDEQLGLAIGAKRLQTIVATADSVLQQGLSQYAKSQGLGKSQS